MSPATLAQDAAPTPMLLDAMSALNQRAEHVIQRLRASVFAPGEQKVVDLRFTISRTAEMVGRTPEAIRQAELDGRLPTPRIGENGRREGYTLAEVNHMRDEIGRAHV